jgi:hypothetical protein
MPRQARQTWLVATLALGLAIMLLGRALQVSLGSLQIGSMLALTAALGLATLSLGLRLKRPLQLPLEKWHGLILGACMLFQIGQLLTAHPGGAPYATLESGLFPAGLTPFRVGVAVMGGLMALSLWVAPPWRQRLGLGVVALFFCLGVWIIRVSPHPVIDVYELQQTSAAALAQGQNPYTLKAPNLYGDMVVYGPQLLDGNHLTIGNPYPPVSIYISSLGDWLAGDIRDSHLALVALAGALLIHLRTAPVPLFAAYSLLSTLRIFSILEGGWTEPLVVGLLALTVLGVDRQSRWAPIAVGLLLSRKQYCIVVLPVIWFLLPPTVSWRARLKFYGLIAGVAVAVTAPLAFWNVNELFWNVGFAQWYQVFRANALSYPALYYYFFGQQLPTLIAFALLVPVMAWLWRAAPRPPSGFALAVALALFVFFAFNKQAFGNYYFLVIGALCCALAAWRAPVEAA